MDTTKQSFNSVNQTAWETFIFLMAWDTFNDTIPAMLGLMLICVVNGILLQNRQYIKKFIVMAFISYVFYFAHIWLLRGEYKLFDTDLPLYDFIVSYFIVWELHVLLTFADKVYGLRIPLITHFFEKWSEMMDRQSTPRRKKGNDD
jgi:hypothetical protein